MIQTRRKLFSSLRLRQAARREEKRVTTGVGIRGLPLNSAGRDSSMWRCSSRAEVRVGGPMGDGGQIRGRRRLRT